MITIKTKDEINGIKKSCALLRSLFEELDGFIKEGITTKAVDVFCENFIKKHGGKPAFLYYDGFPASACISINEEVIHGIPSSHRIIKNGDLVKVDLGINLNGYFSDSSRMFCIGEVSPEKKRLVQVTKECVEAGLKAVKPWGFLGDMGQAVHDHAYENGYTVVREIGGHGVGLEFHEEPWVGYNSRRGTQMVLAPGMVFTIEPMVNMGGVEIYIDDENDWEVYTEDGLPSAQWEIMVLVTEDGAEVLCW